MSSLWLVIVTAGVAAAHPASDCVCLPFTQCDENGQILEYGDLITIDVRLGGSCGIGEVCCSLPPDDSWSKEKDQEQPGHQTFQGTPFLVYSNYNYNPYTSTEKPGYHHDQVHPTPDWIELPKEKHDKPGGYFSKNPYDAASIPVVEEIWGENKPEEHETQHSYVHKHCKDSEKEAGALSAFLPKGLHGCGLRRHTPLDARFQTIPFLKREYTLYGEYPWTIAIWKKGTEQFLCGGSLIKPDVVLTAAHCVFIEGEKGELIVTAGDWDIKCDSEPVPRQVRGVRRIVVHEEYQSRTLLNDIALLLLDQPMELNEAVDVICLCQEIPHNAHNCLATGWSARQTTDKKNSSVMSMVKLPMVKRDTCLKKLRTTRLGHYFKLHKSFMCAGGEENVDTCKGDGGGPLVCQDMGDPEGRFFQVGIVSWGIDCGTDVPAVYTSVPHFFQWIHQHLNL